MIKTLTDQNFEEEVLKSGGLVIVDFWALWCGPCQMMSPIIDELNDELNGKAIFFKMNIDENPQTVQRYNIISIPNLLIFKNGEVINQIIGLQNKAVLKEKILKLLE